MRRSVVFPLLLLAAIARADDFDTWFAASPDKKFVAVERRVPDSDQRSRLDLDGFAVFICSGDSSVLSAVPAQGAVVAQHTFEGRVVSYIGWSPDSQFLLFTTASSGGHSPWHYKTFVFCAADKSFRDVEPAAGGSIGAADFRFEPPDIALLKLHQPDSDTPTPIKVALGKVLQQMERVE